MCLYNSFSTRVAGTHEYSSKQLFSQPEHYGRIVGVLEMSDCLKVAGSIFSNQFRFLTMPSKNKQSTQNHVGSNFYTLNITKLGNKFRISEVWKNENLHARNLKINRKIFKYCTHT